MRGTGRNWPAVEIVSHLIREVPGYVRGACIDPVMKADGLMREMRQSVLAELRAKLFDSQNKRRD